MLDRYKIESILKSNFMLLFWGGGEKNKTKILAKRYLKLGVFIVKKNLNFVI